MVGFRLAGEPVTRITLADRARDARQWVVAARYYQKALRRNPNRPAIWVQYGHALKESGNLLAAESAYRKAIAGNPGVADSYLQLGHALKLEGKRDEARNAYLQAFVLDPVAGDPRRELTALGCPEELLARVTQLALRAGANGAPVLGGGAQTGTAIRALSPAAGLFARLAAADRADGSPIHPADDMCSPRREQHYYAAGRNALWNVIQSMIGSDLSTAHHILDFPSGFGRVTRYLRAAFPEARIDVGDIWQDAVVHCAAAYGASRIAVEDDFRDIAAAQYDVIFCGSLVTHLPEAKAVALLDFFGRHLEIGGIAVVTCSGRRNLLRERQHFNAQAFGTRDTLERLTKEYYAGRYSYADYPNQQGYGRAFTPVSWFHSYVGKNPQLAITRFAERGWDDNQDVVTLKRLF